MKKIFITFTVTIFCVFLLGAISVSSASGGTCGDNLTWTLDDGTLTISGDGDMYDYSSYLNVYEPWYSSCGEIKNISIGNNVTSLGSSAFANCTELVSVTIPDSVTSIGSYAFENCTGLTNVTIGIGVTSIGTSAFKNCKALTRINWNAKGVSDFLPDNCVFLNAGENGTGISIIFGDNVERIPAYAFYPSTSSDISKIVSITLGIRVNAIGKSAFENCKVLTQINWNAKAVLDFESDNHVFACAGKNATGINVIFGDNAERIPAYAFYYPNPSSMYTANITSVEIGDNVTDIGGYAFYNCSCIKNITIGIGVANINQFAFYGCGGISKVNIDNIESWCNIIFSQEYSNPLHYGGNLYIGGEVITNLVIPDCITSIGNSAFSGCSNIKSVIIPKSVTKIGSSAFANCTELVSVTIPDSVTSIGSYAFENCIGLLNITMSKSITHIGRSAFYGCTGLAGVNIADIGSWCGITFDDAASNPLYYAKKLYLNEETVTNLVVPDGITSIGKFAFYNCTDFISITIPESVANIGNYAFCNCKALTQINWCAKNVADFASNNYVFANAGINADGINVILGDIADNIPAYAFYPDSNSKYIPKIISVTISDSVAKIGNNAFSDCTYLQNVIIGAGVTDIGTSAFENCKALTQINWNAKSAADFSLYNFVFACAGQNSNGLNVVFGDNVEKIPAYAFYVHASMDYVPKVLNLTIGNNVKNIGKYAFRNCSEITQINWNAKNVDDFTDNNFIFADAGKNNSGINVIFGDSVEKIPAYMFYPDTNSKYIPKIKNISIGNSVTSIGSNAFYKCTGISEVNIKDIESWCKIDFSDGFSNPLYYAENFCLNGQLLTNIVIPDNITDIGSYQFYNCKVLKSVTLPEGITHIGFSAFRNCEALTQINWNAKSVADFSFDNYIFTAAGQCGDGITVIFGDNVEKIPACAFYPSKDSYFRPKIATVTIGKNVTDIGKNAFRKCFVITQINWNAKNVTDFTSDNYIFDDIGISGDGVSIIFGDCVERIPAYAFRPYANKGVRDITSITIGENVASIGNYAFYDCSVLTQINWNAKNITDFTIDNYIFAYAGQSGDGIRVVFGDCVEKIPEYTFCTYSESSYTPKIISVTMGSNVKNIASYAFYNCTELQKVNIKNIESWCSIRFGMFYANPLRYTKVLYVNDELITNLVIPKNVTRISGYAFENCTAIEEITMPDSVVNIGRNAFSGCTSLADVYFYGEEPKWESIYFDTNNESLLNATIHYIKHTKTTISADGKKFTVTLLNAEIGKTVILALYDGCKLVEMQSAMLEGDVIIFTTSKSYTDAKLMIWDSFSNLKPVYSAEIVNIE